MFFNLWAPPSDPLGGIRHPHGRAGNRLGLKRQPGSDCNRGSDPPPRPWEASVDPAGGASATSLRDASVPLGSLEFMDWATTEPLILARALGRLARPGMTTRPGSGSKTAPFCPASDSGPNDDEWPFQTIGTNERNVQCFKSDGGIRPPTMREGSSSGGLRRTRPGCPFTRPGTRRRLREGVIPDGRRGKVRADIGALKNRLENTITNLEIRIESLQASESRISVISVATSTSEMRPPR